MKLVAFITLAALAACGHRASEPIPSPSRIEVGDCAPISVAFESGPRPQPFVVGDSLVPVSDGPHRGGFAALTGTGALGTDDLDIFDGVAPSLDLVEPRAFAVRRYRSRYPQASGWGGYWGRTEQSPTVAFGIAETTGSDPAIVRRYLRRSSQQFQYCYEKATLANPRLGGVLTSTFSIAADGRVAETTAIGVDPDVATCFADAVKRIEFPAGTAVVHVTQPFTLTPSPDAPLRPVVRPQPVAPDPAPVVFADASYTPGSASPLRLVQPALLACARASGEPYGAIVVDVAYDAAGAITASTVGGSANAAFGACVATALRAVKRGPHAAERCGFAFGTLPAAEVPTIAITADAVTLNGAIVERTRAIVDDPQPTWRLVALAEALAKRAHPATVVPIHGPALVEPLATTPMKVVSRTIATCWGFGLDVVLSTQRGVVWQPLRDVTRPVAPVPVGTGDSWLGIGTGHYSIVARMPHDARDVPIVIVGKDVLWIGEPSFAGLHRIDHDWAAVEAHLRELAAAFGDREDLEISSDDDASYGDIVTVIELATRVGFTDWHLVPPNAVALVP